MNLRPPGPEPGALTGLRYAPTRGAIQYTMAGDGFKRDLADPLTVDS